jgi:hydroxymethylglutaryl-CoA lyase
VEQIKIIECPRDAMQGLPGFIPTADKIRYLKLLLEVGFDTLDFGSFVSAKAIPQMRDTHEVIAEIGSFKGGTRLLAIVANERGALEAVRYPEIDFLGFPFSISETFQIRNTNSTIEVSMERLREIFKTCQDHGKELVVYLSMAFGNPYGDPWNADVVSAYIEKLSALGMRIFALSDTIGVAHPDSIRYLFESLIPRWKGLEIGAHFHTTPDSWEEKIRAAWEGGCRRFDGAIRGFGGCPMAKDVLTGNMPTEKMLQFFQDQGEKLSLDWYKFDKAIELSGTIFKS